LGDPPVNSKSSENGIAVSSAYPLSGYTFINTRYTSSLAGLRRELKVCVWYSCGGDTFEEEVALTLSHTQLQGLLLG
jgi:hypothetical protein